MDQRPIVIDIGSGFTKAGFCSQDVPEVTFPSLMHSRNPSTMTNMMSSSEENIFVDESYFMFGDDVRDFDAAFRERPISIFGLVQNWRHLEFFLKHVFFTKLKLERSELCNHPVLIAERVNSPKLQRQRLTQLLFERFDCSSVSIMNSSLMSLYSTGRTTGIVLDVGEHVSTIVPLTEGYPLVSHAKILPTGGGDVSRILQSDLIRMAQQDQMIDPAAIPFLRKPSFIRQLKERHAFVAETPLARVDETQMDCSEDVTPASASFSVRFEIPREVQLPDGRTILLPKSTRSKCCEVLFDPHGSINRSDFGLQVHLFNVLRKCSLGLRQRLMRSMILCGGPTMTEGFQNRMRMELGEILPRAGAKEVVTMPKRGQSVFIGGAILTSLKSFEQVWVQKDEYNDWGPQAIDRKYI